jgi:hypothetical protein
MSTMMVNGCEDDGVSISMDDRQRSPILDELSAWLLLLFDPPKRLESGLTVDISDIPINEPHDGNRIVNRRQEQIDQVPGHLDICICEWRKSSPAILG